MSRPKRKTGKDGQVRCPTCDVERMIRGWWVGQPDGTKVYRRTLPATGAALYRCSWCNCRIAVMPEE